MTGEGYGAGNEILAETDGSGNTTAEYIFFGGKRIAMLPAGGTVQYYVEDFLGSSRVVTSSSGVVCYDADFTPFGGELSYTNSCPAQNNYKFEGKERDTETGNDDFGARSYTWRFGRWLSADWSSVPVPVPVPYANLTNPQTLNLYAIVADDPESFADLDGHMWGMNALAADIHSAVCYDPSCPNPLFQPGTMVAQSATGTANQQPAAQNQTDAQDSGGTGPVQASAPAIPLTGAGTGTGASVAATVLATVAAGAAVVAAAATLITNTIDTLVANSKDRERLAAVESRVSAENAAILMSQAKHTKDVINGLLQSANQNLGRMKGPEDEHHRNEVRAALTRATNLAERLTGKAKQQILQQIKSLAGRVPGGLQ